MNKGRTNTNSSSCVNLAQTTHTALTSHEKVHIDSTLGTFLSHFTHRDSLCKICFPDTLGSAGKNEAKSRTGPVRTVWSLTKTSAKSCTWDKITKEPSTGCNLCGWEAACWNGPGSPGGQAEHDSAVCCCSKGKLDPWAASAGASLADRDVINPLLSACQAAPGVLRPVLVPTIQKRHGQTAEGPKEGHNDDQTAGEPDLWGRTEGVKPFPPGEEKARGGPHYSRT